LDGWMDDGRWEERNEVEWTYMSRYPLAFSPGSRMFSSASEAWSEVASEFV